MIAKPMRAALALLLLFATLAAAHTGLWRYTGAQLERGFTTWVAQRRAQGWTLDHAPPTRGGWPMAATLSIPNLRIAGTAPLFPAGAEWEAQALTLRIHALRPDRLVVEARGRQRLRIDQVELPFAADRLEASFPLESGVPLREAELTVERLRMNTPAGPLALREGRLAGTTRATATEAEPALNLTLALLQLDLPESLAADPTLAALGRGIERLGAEAILTGPLPGGRDLVIRAGQWRDGGGTVELRSLALRWGSLEGTASATLTLDEELQPMGTARLRIAGAQDLIRALAAGGVMTPRSAIAASTAILLLQRPGESGSPAQVELPLTLEQRRLTVARVPVTRLPTLTWPRRAPEPSNNDDPTLPPRR